MPWTLLPDGESIELVPGATYAVVASVKASHTPLNIKALINQRGLALVDYAEEGQRAGLGPDPRGPGYRYVAAMATATAAGELPWSVPWPLSVLDGSAIVDAWVSPAGAPSPAAAPALPVPRVATPAAPSIAPVAIALAAAAAWGSWYTRKKRGRR